jgi:WD40 repeat protein
MERDQLYQLMAAQLRDDGFTSAANAVASATLTRLPGPGTVSKHALQRQLTGSSHTGPTSVDLLESGTRGAWCDAVTYELCWEAPLSPSAARFSPDGRMLGFGGIDGSVQIYDAASIMQKRGGHGPLLHAHDHSAVVNDLDFHPRASILVSASQARDGALRLSKLLIRAVLQDPCPGPLSQPP